MRLTNLAIKQLIKEELRRFLLQEASGGKEYDIFDVHRCRQNGIKNCISEHEKDPWTESDLNAKSDAWLDNKLRQHRRILSMIKKEDKKAFKKAMAGSGGWSQEPNLGGACDDWVGKPRPGEDRPEKCRTVFSEYYSPIVKTIGGLKRIVKKREEGEGKQEPKTGRDLPYEDQKILRRQAMGTERCDAGVYSTPEIGKFAYKICMRSKGHRTEEDISAAAGRQRTLEGELYAFEKAGKKCSNSDPSAPRCPEGSMCVGGECKKIPGWTGGADCVQNCVDQGGDEERCKETCKKTGGTGTEYEEQIHAANLKPNCEGGCPPGTVCTPFGAPRRQKRHCVKITVMSSTGVQAYMDKYTACINKAAPDEGPTAAQEKRCRTRAGWSSRKARKLAATGVGAGPPAAGPAGRVPSRRTGKAGRVGKPRIGAAYRRGLPNLKKEGFNSYKEFYAALKAKGLMGELGPRGQDQKWGPYHRGAMKALKGMATTAAPAGSPEFNQRLAPEKDISPHGTAGYPERGCGDSKGGYAPGISRDGAGGTVSWWQCAIAGKDLTPGLRK